MRVMKVYREARAVRGPTGGHDRGDTSTTADEADILISAQATDVRKASDGSDYTDSVLLNTTLRITDQTNDPFGGAAGTVQDADFSLPMTCVATGDTNTGATCSLNTTGDTLLPGLVKEGKRTVISTYTFQLKDAGPDGSFGTNACPGTSPCGTGDEAVFLRQGLFAP
jgi:hypothetical protein